MNRSKAVVLLSGGQDSTTALYSAVANPAIQVVGALGFDYGQRHQAELELARMNAEWVGVPFAIRQIDVASKSSLTTGEILNVGEGAATNVFAEARDLPPSFTPGRNLLFFSYGAIHCAMIGADTLITGVCAQDYQGYPDCRPEFVSMMEASIRLGFDWKEFSIGAPILNLSKADTWRLAEELGVLDAIIMHTNSCYEGDRETRHPWGYGCGACGACVEREKGFKEHFFQVRA